MDTERYKQAWKEFQNKMAELRKRQLEILSSITKKLDQQKIANIMDKLKK